MSWWGRYSPYYIDLRFDSTNPVRADDISFVRIERVGACIGCTTVEIHAPPRGVSGALAGAGAEPAPP